MQKTACTAFTNHTVDASIDVAILRMLCIYCCMKQMNDYAGVVGKALKKRDTCLKSEDK